MWSSSVLTVRKVSVPLFTGLSPPLSPVDPPLLLPPPQAARLIATTDARGYCAETIFGLAHVSPSGLGRDICPGPRATPVLGMNLRR
jgi:hypothetical protein